MLNDSEEKIVPFPLDLSSLYVMIATNQLILNYREDIRVHVRLMKCENHLKNSQDL